MRMLRGILYSLFFLLAFGIAVKNSKPVSVSFFLDQAWEVPLSLLLFICLLLGVVLGFLAGVFTHKKAALSGTVDRMSKE